MNDVEVRREIERYKRINNKNNIIIMIQVAVLVFVAIMAIYVRFFS